MKQKAKAIFVTVLIISFALTSFRQSTLGDRTFEIVKNLDIFTTLYKEVNAYYVDDVNPAKLMRIGITAMLASLDPFTNYIAEDDIEDYRTMTTGEYGGIGAVVDRKDGKSTIVMPYEGYPAYNAGVKAGDQIIEIDGISIKDKTSDEIGQMLKGQSNTELVLSIKRFGKDELLKFTLKREKIKVKNVPYYGMVDKKTGYLKLTDFTKEAGAEVRKAVVALKEQGAVNIILDLRGNPGGLLEEAVNVCNVFINKNMEVVTTKGKLKNSAKTYKTLNEPVDVDMPFVVLVNNSSASASEIVSGVAQDYDRGVLIGQQTYGKGLVQQSRPLVYNAQLKVTTAKYYIPSGRCIQAIDYSHRNEDGGVGKIPDSLRSEFKTAAGRLVYDGGGVSPDIMVDDTDFAPVTYTLMRQHLIFDYATYYYYSKPAIESIKDFELSDSEYQDFITWLSGKSFDYTTQLENEIERLVEASKKEKNYPKIESQIVKLQQAAKHDKDQDLINFKDEIKFVLQREIAGRYFFERGLIETSFKKDPELKEAVKLFADTDRYRSILNRN